MSIANPAFKPVPTVGFDHIKSAQIVAYFVRKAGGRAEKLKLVKLLYLSERRSFEQRTRPMVFDAFFSLPHGPVNSTALNGMDQLLDHPVWAGVNLAENRRDVTVTDAVGDDRLSRYDRRILDETWAQFGGMSASQIRNWTHSHCPEYVEVGPSASLVIEVSDILRQVGHSEPELAARALRALQMDVGRLERVRAA